MLFPQPRRELIDLCGRVTVDALQNVDEVVVGIDAVKLAGDDQALHDADLSRTQFGPTEHPVLATQRNRTQAAFQVVRVHRQIRLAEKQ